MKLSRTLELLQGVAIFSGLDEKLLEPLAQVCRFRHFGANEALFHEGDPGHTLYIIVSGQVRIQKVSASGKTMVLAHRGAGETIGEMAVLSGEPRSADAVTGEPSELLMLERSDFVRYLVQVPEVALNVVACLASRLREAMEQREEREELDVLGRVAKLLLDRAETPGGEPVEKGELIEVTLSQQQIADQIGATRVSVNRAIARLKSAQALRIEGRAIIIVNLKALRKYATA